MKQKCKFKERQTKHEVSFDDEDYEREALKLNKLEAYILKLCIPFIRLAHCPRGPYFKVKGDLILISADVNHSLSKVLPLEQSLIPVSFKRKLSYHGSYLEEYVEKEKIKLYFAWLKKHNHLYKDIELSPNLIESFEAESLSSAQEFENTTREADILYQSEQESEESVDNNEIYFENDGSENYDLHQNSEQEYGHDKTSMFLNKYCENIDAPTVVNRIADMIIDYEINKGIRVEHNDDFDIDNEIITEEQFLQNVDEELDRESMVFDDQINKDMESGSQDEEVVIDINDQLSDNEEEVRDNYYDENSSQSEGKDKVADHLDVLINPSKEESETIADSSRKKASNINKRMEKVSVAPGEHGLFKNWGDDTFLEEKSFPQHFPYGTGGYLSSCINDPENNMGFAAYCIHNLSC